MPHISGKYGAETATAEHIVAAALPERLYRVHGFLAVGGAFSTVDFPGADVTIRRGINNTGSIVGNYSIGILLAGFLATTTH